VNPGGRGSLPGAQMGTTKGRWEVIGLRVPEPRACEGVDMEELILQGVRKRKELIACLPLFVTSYYIQVVNSHSYGRLS
jgi:hypothetical protein